MDTQVTALTPEELVTYSHAHLATIKIKNRHDHPEETQPAWSNGFDFVMRWMFQAGAAFPNILEGFYNDCGRSKRPELGVVDMQIGMFIALIDTIDDCLHQFSNSDLYQSDLDDYYHYAIPHAVAASPPFVWQGHTFFAKKQN